MDGFDAPVQQLQTIASNGTKSASILNVLPFILLYILYNHQEPVVPQKGKQQVIVKDKLYDYIPDKTNQISPNLKYFIMAFAIIGLLFKSNNNTTLEHTFVILSYVIGIKASMYFLTPSLPKRDFANIIFITIIFNLMYFDIIPREHRQGGVLGSIAYSILLLMRRETTSAIIISDYTIASLAFLFAKMN